MPAVPADDGKLHVMPGQKTVEQAPLFLVFQRLQLLSLASTPSVPFPAREPFAASTGDVLTVCDDFDARTPFESFQTGDDRLQLHPIVRGICFATRRFDGFSAGRMPQNVGPAPRA